MYFRHSAAQRAAHAYSVKLHPDMPRAAEILPNHKPATAFLLVLFPKFVQFFFRNHTDSCGPEFMGSDPITNSLSKHSHLYTPVFSMGHIYEFHS